MTRTEEITYDVISKVIRQLREGAAADIEYRGRLLDWANELDVALSDFNTNPSVDSVLKTGKQVASGTR